MSTNRVLTGGADLRMESDGVMTGYAAMFNEPASGLPFHEELAPGCFRSSLESGSDVLACVDHNPERLLGRTSSGTLKLDEDKRGLRFELQLPQTQLGRDVAEQVRRKDLQGCSFAFNVKSDSWQTDGNQRSRRIDDVELLDVSLCALPAYGCTNGTVSLRSDLARMTTMNDSDIAAQLEAARDEQRAIADKDVATITEADEQRFGELDSRVAELEKSAKWMQRRSGLSSQDAPQAVPVVAASVADRDDELRSMHHYMLTGQAQQRRGTNNTGTGSEGGFLVPEFWSQSIIDKVREIGSVMGLANVQSIEGKTNYSLVTTRPSFSWIAEGAAPADSSLAFSQATVGVKTVGGRCIVTRDLLADSISGFNESYLQMQMATGMSEAVETALHGGTGADSDTPDGIGTAVASANQVTAGHATDLAIADVFSTYTTLGAAYRNAGTWLVSPGFLDQVRQMTTGSATGQYIWTVANDPGLVGGYAGQILGRPVVVSSYLDEPATGKTVAYFGDFSRAFLVGLRGGMEMISDPYTLANKRQVALNMWSRMDTAVLDDNALTNLTMA